MIDLQLMMRGASFNIFDRSEPEPDPEECPYSREDLFPWSDEPTKAIDASWMDLASEADQSVIAGSARQVRIVEGGDHIRDEWKDCPSPPEGMIVPDAKLLKVETFTRKWVVGRR